MVQTPKSSLAYTCALKTRLLCCPGCELLSMDSGMGEIQPFRHTGMQHDWWMSGTGRHTHKSIGWFTRQSCKMQPKT